MNTFRQVGIAMVIAAACSACASRPVPESVTVSSVVETQFQRFQIDCRQLDSPHQFTCDYSGRLRAHPQPAASILLGAGCCSSAEYDLKFGTTSNPLAAEGDNLTLTGSDQTAQ